MVSKAFIRPAASTLEARLREPRRFIQILAGPRQVGKTTLAHTVAADLPYPVRFAAADEVALEGTAWVATQWALARVTARDSDDGALLILDEVQKIPGWSEAVKRLWDEDSAASIPLRVLLLGSSPLLMQRGLTESLAGRFEITRAEHWSFSEMRDAFGWDLDTYVFFGGYPGSAPLIGDLERWRSYVRDSLIETTVSRDILLMTRVDKPALLRQLFSLACAYSGRVLSYQNMLGQLQDAGNTVTLAHYLELLSGAGLAMGLQKFSGSTVRVRGSSPKLLVLNNALITAQLGLSPREARADERTWGALVESAVGAHLVRSGAVVTYWRERNLEVDFVTESEGGLVAVEVTSGARTDRLRGLDRFAGRFDASRMLVGGQGVPLGEFLAE